VQQDEQQNTAINTAVQYIRILDEPNLEIAERELAQRRRVVQSKRALPKLVTGQIYEFRYRPTNSVKVGRLRRLVQGGRVAYFDVYHGDRYIHCEVPKENVLRNVTPVPEMVERSAHAFA
jgi:hypothetical protein